MPHIHPHGSRRHYRCTIDITPLPWWRRAGGAALALLAFIVAVPLLWLLGAVLATVLVAGAFAMLSYAVVARGLSSRVEADSRGR